MAGKMTSPSKKKCFKIMKSLQKGTTNVHTVLNRLLGSLKPKKKSDKVPAKELEDRLTQMLSVSTNDLLNINSTMAGVQLLTLRAQRHILGL